MKQIAIIGSGISGLTTAYLLSQKHQVTVYEKNDYIGGHTATVDIEINGESHAVDTGFIVFNDKTYPNFLALLSNISMSKQPTEMSFSVHNISTGLEYNGHTLRTLFAQKRNIFNPRFWLLLKEIARFNKQCKHAYETSNFNEALTLGDFLNHNKYGAYFCEHYILPMGAAIWSTSLAEMEQFDFKFFVQFFHHHGLLNIVNRPQWYVIPGGSKNYIKPLCERFENNIQLNANIECVTRDNGKVQLHFSNGENKTFDEIIFACHSDQALALLKDVTATEQSVLSDLPYSANSVVLHTDHSLLPVRKRAWASWNYQLSENREKPASVTYNMNILQGIQSEHTFCVSLNQKENIAPDKILKEFTYHHPVFSKQSSQAQQRRNEICGVNNTHFTGAYWHNGFHEDGVKSAVEVAQRFGCYLSLENTND